MAAPAMVKASSNNIPHIRPMAAPTVVYDGANVTDRIKTCAEQKINLNTR